MITRCCHGPRLVLKCISDIYPKSRSLFREYGIFEDKYDNMEGFSLQMKKLPAREAGIYALYPGVNLDNTLDFIISFQTIDRCINHICSKIKDKDELLIGRLYLSLRDAVDPKRRISVGYINGLDSKYVSTIIKLVERCRNQVVMPPSYNLVITRLKKFIQMYSDFMTCSHLDKELRNKKIEEWVDRYYDKSTGISKTEIITASASPLLVFVLFACAHDPYLTREEVDNIWDAYFPWICGLHALLYNFVNVNDVFGNNNNLAFYYKNLKMYEDKITFFIEKSLESCNKLKYPEFHRTAVKMIIALYLSNPQAYHGMNRLASTNIMKKSGSAARFYYNLCKLLRLSGKF